MSLNHLLQFGKKYGPAFVKAVKANLAKVLQWLSRGVTLPAIVRYLGFK